MEQVKKEILQNDILQEVQSLLEYQTIKGLVKYGNTVDPEQYTTIEWIDHARQECIDTLVYLTILKRKMEDKL